MNFRDEKLLLRLGQKVQQMRISKGYTQEDLAYESGLSLSQIARIETGRLNSTICTLSVIAKTLKVELKDLADIK